MQCGTIKAVIIKERPNFKFTGTINLGKRLNGDLLFFDNPRADKADDAIPAYVVTYRHGGSGNARNIGSCWVKVIGGGEEFFSLTLDDPDWSGALNLAAFFNGMSGDDAGYDLVWTRPRQQRQAA